MSDNWKFEPDPFTKGYIKYLDKSPIKFDEELTCPNRPIERDPYYLTDDVDNYIVKEYATDEVVAIIKRSKLRDWEAFHAASDVVNYLNLNEEEKNKPLKDW